MTTNLFDAKELEKVAALYCEGMGKEDIARVLSRDESDTQRMIEAARQFRYFSEQPVLTVSNLSPTLHLLSPD